jgi:hypothetical protein
MKVYFAGSIKGGRGGAALYHRIIEYIKKTDPVLTEHVGNLNLQENNTPEGIYDQDTAWLKEADVLIAECSNPSLGVGYELAFGEKLGKPCHIFYDKSRTVLSAMLSGDPYFILHPYEREEEIYPAVDKILESLRGEN